MKKFLRLSLVTAVMLTFTGAVLAQVISFDAGPNGNTYPSGINEEGRIVGSFYDENGMSFGFLQKKDGSFVLFNAGSIWTFFNAINSKGQIVGTTLVSDVNDAEFAGFLLQPYGTIIGLTIGQQDAHPVDINGAGVIVGDYQDTNWKTHGFVRKSDGTFASIDVIGSISTTPVAVNQVGQIVGAYWVDRIMASCGSQTVPSLRSIPLVQSARRHLPSTVPGRLSAVMPMWGTCLTVSCGNLTERLLPSMRVQTLHAPKGLTPSAT
jgi:uncharacterized membrane protein